MRVRKEEEKEQKRSDWPENQNLRLYSLTKQTPTRERKEIVKPEQKHERKWRRSFTRELKEEERLKQDKKDEWDWDWLNEVNSITTEPESVERKDERWMRVNRQDSSRMNSTQFLAAQSPIDSLIFLSNTDLDPWTNSSFSSPYLLRPERTLYW